MFKQITAYVSVFFFLLFVVFPPIVLAADPTPTPTPTSAPPATQSITTESNPDATVQTIKSFINSFDSFLGGFIFYTPDLFGDTITLKDGTTLAGLSHYRDMFFAISIPIVALITAFIAVRRIGDDRPDQLRKFLVRLLICAALFIVTPTVLSLTIQANNMLVTQIQNEDSYTTFINEYLDNVSTQIHAGAPPEQFGMPSFNFSIIGGIFKSLGTLFVQFFLFVITFLFFLVGFLFIAFQFVIRFAALLFLSVFFPVVIPFVLSEKTENITITYFRTWLSFLLHQPAFVLGYVLAISIFRSILEKNGASLGMLFFYTGFLFFLAGVNVMVGRIFADAWTAIATNVTATLASSSATKALIGNKDWNKGGLARSGASLAYQGGKFVGQKAGLISPDKTNNSGGNGFLNNGQTETPKRGESISSVAASKPTQETAVKLPPYSRELKDRGFEAKIENQKQGVVALSGEGYQYTDNKTNLTSIYPNRADAIADGIAEEKLKPVALNDTRFIDLSSFSKNNPNPHNANATMEAKKQGFPATHAHLTHTSSPDRVKNFLTLAQDRNQPLGIKGVVVKRFGNMDGKNTKERVVRLYTTEKL